jgi:hypothetical protein
MPNQKKAIEAITRPGVQISPFHSGGSRLEVVNIPGYTPLTADDIQLLPELPWTSKLRIVSGDLIDEWLPYASKIRGIRALEIGRGQPPARVTRSSPRASSRPGCQDDWLGVSVSRAHW